MSTRFNWLAGVAAVVLLVGIAGCGTGLADALYQTASAAGRTTLDMFLTDVANAIADACDDATDDDDADDNGDEGDDGGDVPTDELTPDPDAGAASYAAGCAACHCDDGSGGCAASAPGVQGATLDALSAVLGDAAHFGQGPLDDQELVDIEAFLGS